MFNKVVLLVTLLGNTYGLSVVEHSVRSFEFPSNGQAPPPQAPSQGLDR